MTISEELLNSYLHPTTRKVARLLAEELEKWRRLDSGCSTSYSRDGWARVWFLTWDILQYVRVAYEEHWEFFSMPEWLKPQYADRGWIMHRELYELGKDYAESEEE